MESGELPDLGYETFPSMLRSLTGRFAERECIVLGSQRATFAAVEAASATLARQLLATGVGKGTRVGLLAPNGPDFVIALFAVERIGAILVPVNTLYQSAEIAWTLRHADIHTLITVPHLLSHDYVARLEEAIPVLAATREPDLRLVSMPYLRQIIVLGACDRRWSRAVDAAEAVSETLLAAVEEQVSAGDQAVVIYTSGSTANPKAIVHTQGPLVRHSWWAGQAHGLVPDDRVYTPNAFFFIGGLVFSLLAPMQMGARLLCEERFDTEKTLDLLERERATIVTGWPHYGPAMRAHESFARRDLSAIRAGYLYEILPPTATRFHYSLGMTETCSSHSFWPPDRDLPEGSLGVAVPGVEYKVVDPESGALLPPGATGELCVRGYTLMQGMYKRERTEVFDSDGWYHTGDEVTLDGDGHLHFHGRLGDVIKTGGVNVSPREVEAVLIATAGVLEAHVVGLPDGERGQLVAAAVVLDGSRDLSAEDLRSQLRTKLAAYKVPKRFDFFTKPELPYKATGKIDKLALIERLRRVSI